MSAIMRRGTVSKSSGPIHSNSYAMRGVAVRYKTPIFVPELLQLPTDWVKPTLPSSLVFTYDYSLERRVSEQARHRAISIAAEASLQRKQVSALLKQQQLEQEEKDGGVEVDGTNDSSSQHSSPNPLLLLTSDILTPTPVAPSTSQSSPTVSGKDTNQSGASSGEGGSTSSLLEDNSKATSSDQTGKSESVFKSLGNWSIKEFEGGGMDPFESTSLQAINDMEVLQSVLQPMKTPQPVPVVAPSTSASSPSVIMSQSQTPPLQSSPTTISGGGGGVTSPLTNLSSNSSPDLRLNTSAGAQMPARTGSDGSVVPLTSTAPHLEAQAHFGPPQGMPAMSTNPFLSSGVTVRNSNPFLNSEPPLVAANHHHPHFTVQGQLQQPLPQERSQADPGVGTLVDLGAGHLHQKPPVPVPRSPRSGRNVPVPKPRKRSPSPSGGVMAQPLPTTTATTITPVLGNIHPNPGGPNSPLPTTRVSGNSNPVFPPSGHNPMRMGVAVLPQITSTSSSAATPPSTATPLSQPAVINEAPPAYKLRATPPTVRKPSPPPPYSSPGPAPGGGHRQHPVPALTPPTVPRKTYILPNPEASLTMEQRKQVGAMAGMGFPPQRVGRAILRFEDDQTKVLDFLFLVSKLEEAKYDGNSAETALVACEDNLDKAKEYLVKLDMYKEIGFQEKAIHEAYTKSDKGDWDEVLDILTRSR